MVLGKSKRVCSLVLVVFMLINLCCDLSVIKAASSSSMTLVNSMSAGYDRDYLTIVRDHCSGRYMNSGVLWPRNLSCPAQYVLGTTLREVGYYKLPNGNITLHSNLDISNYSYGQTINGTTYDLYTVNSAWFKQNGLNYIDKIFDSSMKDGNYYTQFQLSRGHLAMTPVSNTGSGGSYPSLMNGYGYSSGGYGLFS